ncbi:MAG: type I restriction endonuclease subunit R [Prosthecobacter sp.]|jgi:type I restriction enzyme R subunit|uniref:type I restriction endonuclease subunit R n=1 Tax=Prosthecobacter sp. TaxID=1965333 RepID=UPI001A00388E|nr:type I restriction endonuclease subunit R [Prosthecobacter sp.]MBE2283972.1 type I restriction endonuclease subunit R [Prosthecobacter sp.]
MPPNTLPFTQPEQALENELVAQLVGQGFAKAAVTDEATMLANLKAELGAFNGLKLSELEFSKVLNHLNRAAGVFAKAKTLRDRMQLKRDDGSTVWISFFEGANPLKNRYQVTQQVTAEGTFKNRYDVTILVNGLPLVQIELKRRGLEMKEAFNQIQRYQKHSFWSGQGLFQFVQLFVISNGVNTKYYANARRQSFKQTFYWAAEDNKTIRELPAFASAFLNREHLGAMIGKYIVLNETDKVLMVLRPYQYYAVERIVERVLNPPAENPNGYIWHTTGSGKTLTSFKAAQILTALSSIAKVVFCVDRKDLDYQTIKEFNGFQKDSVDSTNDTKTLVRQFSDDTTKLIVTTLQKLNTAISKQAHLKQMEKLRGERIIFIFDECHRSQFGDTHRRITEFFTNHQMFGFTGTPIFAENAVSKDGKKHTTKDLFHQKLHSYVITDAIKDENVLKFAVEYVGRYQRKPGSATEVDIEVEGIDTKELMNSPQRLEKIVDYVIEHHAVKTRNKEFTAMMCVSSVETLIQYYELFAARKAAGKHKLRVATIFSYTSNEEDKDADGILDEGGEIIGGEGGDPHTREKLEKFIGDYNAMFGTAFSTKDTQSFYSYYQDIAKKVKERKVDLLLVVNMFLTGFDSKTLNTLWVDKNLKHHGLIQAYSRTNRILNEVKSQGNIVVFRNLKKRTDEALALFADVNAKETVFVPPYEDYVAKFNEVVVELLKLTPTVKSVKDLKDEEAEMQFVKIFRELMRLRNILESFSEFDDNDLSLPAQRFADYRSAYLDLYDKVKSDNQVQKASILNDVDFELELIHRDVINVQYILQLLARLYSADAEEAPKLRKLILDSVTGDIELRSKAKLIEKFIEDNLPNVGSEAEIPDSFEAFWEKERVAAFDQLVAEEDLDADKLKKVIDRYVYTGQAPLPDPDIAEIILKPMKVMERGPSKRRVFERVVDYVATFIKGIAA